MGILQKSSPNVERIVCVFCILTVFTKQRIEGRIKRQNFLHCFDKKITHDIKTENVHIISIIHSYFQYIYEYGKESHNNKQ